MTDNKLDKIQEYRQFVSTAKHWESQGKKVFFSITGNINGSDIPLVTMQKYKEEDVANHFNFAMENGYESLVLTLAPHPEQTPFAVIPFSFAKTKKKKVMPRQLAIAPPPPPPQENPTDLFGGFNGVMNLRDENLSNKMLLRQQDNEISELKVEIKRLKRNIHDKKDKIVSQKNTARERILKFKKTLKRKENEFDTLQKNSTLGTLAVNGVLNLASNKFGIGKEQFLGMLGISEPEETQPQLPQQNASVTFESSEDTSSDQVKEMISKLKEYFNTLSEQDANEFYTIILTISRQPKLKQRILELMAKKQANNVIDTEQTQTQEV